MGEKHISARLILQQCIHAKLEIKPKTDNSPPEYVEIARGVVAYVCFMKNAKEEIVNKIATTLTSVKLSKNETGQLVSILDLPGSILIVPQASLGGKLKGKRMQYHNNIEKANGFLLYEQLVSRCKEVMKTLNDNAIVKYGTYGNLQVLDITTNGPYTHLIEFD